MLSLQNSTIQLIENYINENRNSFNAILKNTKYEKLEAFKFLPGHAVLLCSLPKFHAELTTTKQEKTHSRKRRHSTLDHPRCESGEINSTEIDDAAIVRERLISKINKFTASKNITVEIDDTFISQFRLENDSYKCLLHCYFCNKGIPCNFNSYWICGNYQAHLKKCNQNVEVLEVNPLNNKLEKPISILKIDNNRKELLNDVLNSLSVV